VDWTAFALSLRLAGWTTIVLLPMALALARMLAWWRFRGKGFVEAMIALPLVLPPTVLGYYLLVSFSGASPIGRVYESIVGHSLVFTFEGLVLASIVFNLPFAVQPMQRAFEAIPPDTREAAWVSGMSQWRTFLDVELPLAWPGVLSAVVLTFAHTMGEFGVVLMVGGSIPGETKTVALAIYDRAQAFDQSAAGAMSAVLLIFSVIAIGTVYALAPRIGRWHA
jgi:molybdate transport system permease protein